MAGAIIIGFTNNPDFSAPTIDLKAVQAAADDLNAALAVQSHGETAATAERNNKWEALIMVLRKRLFMEIEEASAESEAKRCSGDEENFWNGPLLIFVKPGE